MHVFIHVGTPAITPFSSTLGTLVLADLNRRNNTTRAPFHSIGPAAFLDPCFPCMLHATPALNLLLRETQKE